MADALDCYEFIRDACFQRGESKVRDEDQQNSKPGNSTEPKLQDNSRMTEDVKAPVEAVGMPTDSNIQLQALSHQFLLPSRPTTYGEIVMYRRCPLRSVLVNAAGLFKVLAAGAILCGVHIFSYAIDSGSLEFATGNFTQMIRIGAQWDWQYKWFESEDSFLGGYWDMTAAEWRGTRYCNIPRNIQNIVDLGITPVFRFQQHGGIGPYFEAAIGAHLLSDRYDNNGRDLSTRFEFGDSLGIGYQFPSGWDAGLKIQHFSNGGIEEPNFGVNFIAVRISKRF